VPSFKEPKTDLIDLCPFESLYWLGLYCSSQDNYFKTALTTRTLDRPNNDAATYYTHYHWRRQLWGTGARAPLDLQLVMF